MQQNNLDFSLDSIRFALCYVNQLLYAWCSGFYFAESPPKSGWHCRQNKTFSILSEGTLLVTVHQTDKTALVAEQEYDPFYKI